MMRISEFNRRDTVSIYVSANDQGFTLIEMLLALSILALITSLAVLAIPNHDERYWRDNLYQLSSSLNAAQDESELSGFPMLVEINELGWKFHKLNQNHQIISPRNTATLLPDVYKDQYWAKPVIMNPTELTLGDEYVTDSLRIPIEQENRHATLLRSNSGRFSWISP